MSTEELAAKVSGETPWWATAPIWLAAGIVGVPSMIAIGAGWFLAKNVTDKLKALDQYGQSELYLINEHQNDMHKNWNILLKFIDDDLRCQYVTCINSAKDQQERAACISPKMREQEYGIGVEKKK
jgi:hypothetical protein